MKLAQVPVQVRLVRKTLFAIHEGTCERMQTEVAMNLRQVIRQIRFLRERFAAPCMVALVRRNPLMDGSDMTCERGFLREAIRALFAHVRFPIAMPCWQVNFPMIVQVHLTSTRVFALGFGTLELTAGLASRLLCVGVDCLGFLINNCCWRQRIRLTGADQRACVLAEGAKQTLDYRRNHTRI